MVMDLLPFDKYELERSPLTQYILENVKPTHCWQVGVLYIVYVELMLSASMKFYTKTGGFGNRRTYELLLLCLCTCVNAYHTT